MKGKYCRCACLALLLASLPRLASAVPDYFSWSPASSKYSRAIGLNDQGRYGVNSFGPETPYQAASIDGGPLGESVGSLGGVTTQIRSLNNLGEVVGISTTASGESHSFL